MLIINSRVVMAPVFVAIGFAMARTIVLILQMNVLVCVVSAIFSLFFIVQYIGLAKKMLLSPVSHSFLGL